MTLPSIATHDTVILRLPSGVYKLITINPASKTCSLGKFGSFNANDLVGHTYGYTYEIQADKSIEILNAATLKELEEEELGNNEFIVDDNLENQTLSHAEITALRDSGDREALIEKLKRNNKSFDLKTEYSKEKYTARKMAKFAPRFTVIPPTLFDIIPYMLARDADKILNVNQETMAYLLNSADVRPGSHYLVVDDVSGLLVAGLLERGAKITMIHDTEHPNTDILKYFPQYSIPDLFESGRITGLTWEQVVDPDTIYTEIESYRLSKQDNTHPREIEKLRKRDLLRTQLESFHSTLFDGCLIMSEYTPSSVVPLLLPFIHNSRKVSLYSGYREPLLALRHMDLPELLRPSITELRAREIQVLPGRTRPVMTKRGEWGFVFHAIKVGRVQGVQAVGKNQRARERVKMIANRAKKAAAAAAAAAAIAETPSPDLTQTTMMSESEANPLVDHDASVPPDTSLSMRDVDLSVSPGVAAMEVALEPPTKRART